MTLHDPGRLQAGRPEPAPPAPARPGAARQARLGLAVAVLLLVAGCGLRVETPSPTVPAPGAAELARARAATDADDLHRAAEHLLADDASAAPGVVSRVETDESRHLNQLGGIYESGLSPAASSAAPSAPATAAAPSGTASPGTAPVSDLLARLTTAAATARTDALTVPDAALARLIASIALARLQDARALAGAHSLPGPEQTVPAVPAAPPSGVTTSDISAIVLAEDQAGFAQEVVAAKVTDAARATAVARAAQHRTRAQQWAHLASIDGTAGDPRRVAYDLPATLVDPNGPATLAGTVEVALATAYLTMMSNAAPSDRGPLLDLADDDWTAALAWGVAPVPLPALPEQPADQPSAQPTDQPTPS